MPKAAKNRRRLDIYLPDDVARELEEFLYSPLLDRVPLGAFNDFMIARTREFFTARRIPLDRAAGFAPGDWVACPKETATKLKRALGMPDTLIADPIEPEASRLEKPKE